MAVESRTSITLLAETDVAKNGKAAQDDGTERNGTGRTTKKAPFLRRLCPPLNLAPFNAVPAAPRNSETDDDNATLTD